MSKEEIVKLFDSFKTVNPLVIGDVMLDSYIWGKVSRISPEAPVPIVHIKKREDRLGGAANVAINLKELGASPIVCSIIGEDENASILKKVFAENDLCAEGLMSSRQRLTTHKTRIIGNNFQMLRVDDEDNSVISEEIQAIFIKEITKKIETHGINVIIFEDYDKGVITQSIIKEVIAIAKKKNIPTVVDPKKRNFNFYNGVSLFKPNLKELQEGLKLDMLNPNKECLSEAVAQLFNILHNDYTVVTLSDKGIFVKDNASGKEAEIFPSMVRNIADVSGAGDTVISVLAAFMALKTDIYLMTQIANIAGGIVCESIGTVPVNKDKLLKETIIYFQEIQ